MCDTVQTTVLLHLPRNKKIDIEFENITTTISYGRKGKKEILKGVSGKFQSGELSAIMGPSGAGKTSLLNVLTGFQSSGMKGTIKSNGPAQDKKGSEQYKKECCYILQDDQLIPFFTVSEMMNMSTNLKLDKSLSKKSKELIVDDILNTLGLYTCKETRCARLSGGQKKRLSIALELVNNPPVMFLDEPTTGLDSLSSLQCITMLKTLASGGRNIICTIHQPSATIYEMFDYVYAIAEGYCIYKGSSINTVPYLAALGLECPEYHNPADYLLEVANGEYGNFTEHLSKTAKQLNWRGVRSPTKSEIENGKVTEENGSSIAEKRGVLVHSSPTEWTKFLVLLKRTYLQLCRDWAVTYVKLIMNIFIGILMGLIYFNIGNDASQTMSNFGYLLITSAFLCYTAMMPAVLRFPLELPVLKKERFNNWYSLKTYYIAFIVVDTPVQILLCTLHTSISYFMSAQPFEWDRFFMFLIMCWLLVLVSESIGILLGTIVNPINGTFLGAISIIFMMSLAGFLVFLTHMPTPFYILSHISYFRYVLQGLVYSIYDQGRPNIPCPEEATYCHYTSPSVFLKEIGMSDTNYWFSLIMLCCTIVFFRLLAYCTLKRKLSSS